MAEMVQHAMEQMIPELDDFLEKRLFTNEEIHQIVEKRRTFEYMMKRIPLRTIDGLRYIEFELNLNALQTRRKKRLGLKKKSVGDFSGLRRIESIFDRLLFKDRGNIDLWVQYIDFLKAEKVYKKLSQVHASALQYHPNVEELWIEASSHEFQIHTNMDAARALMQRAIRLNRSSQKLWHEYFRLELLFIKRLLSRREVLRLDIYEESKAAERQTETSDLMIFDSEHDQVVNSQAPSYKPTSDLQPLQQEILNGAILQVVFQNAIEQIPGDVLFRLDFIRLVNDASVASLEKLKEDILNSCFRDFPQSEDTHYYKALRPLESLLADSNQDLEIAEKMVIKSLKKSIQQLGTLTMREKFADWITEWTNSVKRSSIFLQHAEEALRWLAFENYEEGAAKIACTCVYYVKRYKGYQSALDLVMELIAKWNEVTSNLSVSWAELWLLYVNLIIHTKSESTNTTTEAITKKKIQRDSDNLGMLDTVKAILMSGFKSVSTCRDKYLLDQCLLELLLGTLTGDPREIDRAFQDALGRQDKDSVAWNSMRIQYMKWIFATKCFPELEEIANNLMVTNRMLPTEGTFDFVVELIHMEMTYRPSDETNSSICKLFEKLVDLFGQRKKEVWTKYMQFHLRRSQIVEANKVFLRARRTFPIVNWNDGYGIAEPEERRN
uniref:U3 small nucleolar RNAassociated protein 6 putative n=1 Tax=Albugo laibachii Nc14 TaxID=890382 RepID=F0WXD2_9STRA|nr:U3 small nucleolar RNAassociated protein 6 putative [Albugo laibachii Nc14]|eukprot:CCA26124.1 U3 small nucleolar RNAassociated protein 6 putative [Albugo laibachii Nc14]